MKWTRYEIAILICLLFTITALSFALTGCAGLAATGAMTSGMEQPPSYYQAFPPGPEQPEIVGTQLGPNTTVWSGRGGMMEPGNHNVYCNNINGSVWCR